MIRPDLDHWLPSPTVRVAHARESDAPADALWSAGSRVRIGETGLLGRLIRWRIPATEPDLTFAELFSQPPFGVLEHGAHALVSGLVGRIWTLRRDYPVLSDPEEFRTWSAAGTARVLFANWVEETSSDSRRLATEVRVDAFGAQGRVGLRAVRPLIGGFHHLIGTHGIELVVRRAEAP